MFHGSNPANDNFEHVQSTLIEDKLPFCIASLEIYISHYSKLYCIRKGREGKMGHEQAGTHSAIITAVMELKFVEQTQKLFASNMLSIT